MDVGWGTCVARLSAAELLQHVANNATNYKTAFIS